MIVFVAFAALSFVDALALTRDYGVASKSAAAAFTFTSFAASMITSLL